MTDYFLLDDIASYLQTSGVGTVGTNIVKGFFPNAPDSLVAVFEYSGLPPDKTANIESPQLQVRVRGTDYNTAKKKIIDCQTALHTLWEQTINGNRYLYISANGSPAYMRKDANNRHEFVQNYTVIRERD